MDRLLPASGAQFLQQSAARAFRLLLLAARQRHSESSLLALRRSTSNIATCATLTTVSRPASGCFARHRSALLFPPPPVRLRKRFPLAASSSASNPLAEAWRGGSGGPLPRERPRRPGAMLLGLVGRGPPVVVQRTCCISKRDRRPLRRRTSEDLWPTPAIASSSHVSKLVTDLVVATLTAARRWANSIAPRLWSAARGRDWPQGPPPSGKSGSAQRCLVRRHSDTANWSG
jgi:hypothetical protein